MDKEELKKIQADAMHRFSKKDEDEKESFQQKILELINERTHKYTSTGYFNKLASQGEKRALILDWPLGIFEGFKHRDIVAPRSMDSEKDQCALIHEALKKTHPKEYRFITYQYKSEFMEPVGVDGCRVYVEW